MTFTSIVDVYDHEIPIGTGPYTSIRQIKDANEALGNFWFSPDTMKFFDSIIEPTVYAGRFFVSSEQPPHGPREYKVRVAWDDGSVSTLKTSDDRSEADHGTSNKDVAIQRALAAAAAVTGTLTR